DDLVHDFLDLPQLGADEQVGLLVNTFALRQQLADAGQRIGAIEQRPVRRMTYQHEDRLRRRPQTRGPRMYLERGEVFRIRAEAAARRDHTVFAFRQFGDDLPLQLAKGRLAVLREDVRDRLARALHDEFVGVDKLEIEISRQRAPDR